MTQCHSCDVFEHYEEKQKQNACENEKINDETEENLKQQSVFTMQVIDKNNKVQDFSPCKFYRKKPRKKQKKSPKKKLRKRKWKYFDFAFILVPI